MCRTLRLVAHMVDNKNTDDTVNLFCSSSCVMAYKVQSVSSSGTGQKIRLYPERWSLFSSLSDGT